MEQKAEEAPVPFLWAEMSIFSCPQTSVLFVFGLQTIIRPTPSVPGVLRPLKLNWIIPQTFLVLWLQIASWDFSASVIMWANSHKKISFICLCVIIHTLFQLSEPMQKTQAHPAWTSHLKNYELINGYFKSLCLCEFVKLHSKLIQHSINMCWINNITFYQYKSFK